jgi:WD40 repeat protein
MLLTADIHSSISELCLNPQGTRLALMTGDDQQEIVVVKVPSGTFVARYTDLGFYPNLMAFRSETKLFVTHGADCWLHDTAKNTHTVVWHEPDEPLAPLACLRLSPNGKSVAFGRGVKGKRLLVLNLGKDGAPRPYEMPLGFVEDVNYSADGRYVAVSCVPGDWYELMMRFLAVVEVKSGKEICFFKLPSYQGYLYPVAFRPDNRVLALGCHSKILLYDLSPAKPLVDVDELFGKIDPIHSMGWSCPMAHHTLMESRTVASLRFDSKGRTLHICCDGGEAMVMSSTSGRVLRQTPPPSEYQGNIRRAVISPSGVAAGIVGEKTVVSWNVPGWSDA